MVVVGEEFWVDVGAIYRSPLPAVGAVEVTVFWVLVGTAMGHIIIMGL